jgi:hypothetical protein
MNEKDDLINKIARYMREEQFSLIHIRAIMNIVVMVNWSQDTEARILEFADKLRSESNE